MKFGRPGRGNSVVPFSTPTQSRALLRSSSRGLPSHAFAPSDASGFSVRSNPCLLASLLEAEACRSTFGQASRSPATASYAARLHAQTSTTERLKQKGVETADHAALPRRKEIAVSSRWRRKRSHEPEGRQQDFTLVSLACEVDSRWIYGAGRRPPPLTYRGGLPRFSAWRGCSP